MKCQFTRLKNKLSIITYSMPNIESLTLGVWIKSGSRNEQQCEHGLAHLLEHMAFKGTKNRTAFEISSAIENVGGDINAATSVETTSYYIRLLGKDLELGIDILADILQNSIIDADELDREKQVVLQEISSAYDSPDDIIFDYFTQTAFPDQEIGRPILGSKETILNFSPTDVKNFLKTQYNPEDMLLIATGCVDHNQFVQEVDKKLGNLPTEIKKPLLKKACYHGGDYREKRDLMDTHLLFGFEGFPYQRENFYDAQLLSIILGNSMSSRLFQEIREKRALCYSIYSFHWGFSDTGIFGIHTSSDFSKLNTLIKVIIKELKKVSEYVSQEEVNRAVAQYRAGLIMAKETPGGLAQSIARQFLLTNTIINYDEIFAKLDNISPLNIQKIAKKIFFSKAPTFTALGQIQELMSYQELEKALKI